MPYSTWINNLQSANEDNYSVQPFHRRFQWQKLRKSSRFRNNLRKWYQRHNWPMHSGDHAHHIRPLAFGEKDDVTHHGAVPNGVWLSRSDHREFTNWWGRPSDIRKRFDHREWNPHNP